MRSRARHACPPIVMTATVLCLASACNSDLPKLGRDAGVLPTECSPYADLLVDYTPSGETGSSDEGERTLGAPDADAIELGPDGVLTVAFVGLGGVIDQEGDDIVVHGSAAEGTMVTAYIGEDLDSIRYSGDLDDATLEIDIGTASASVGLYLRLVGIAGTLSVDAVESMQTTCTGDSGG